MNQMLPFQETEKIRIRQLSEDLETMQEKVVQTIRIKAKLEELKEGYIQILRTSPNQETLQKLWNTYNKEKRLLEIVRGGIINVQKYEAELREILVDVGVLQHFWTIFKRRETNFTLQSVVVLRAAFRKTRKYIKAMNKEFERVNRHFQIQYQLLEKIRAGQTEQTPNLIAEYDREVKSIKKFYRTGINDKLIVVINKIRPKDAAVIIGMNLVPGTAWVSPASCYYFGAQYGMIFAIMIGILKFSSIGGYSAYALRK
jgi:hypothetical protein